MIVCPHCTALNRVPAGRPALQAKCGGCHTALSNGHSAAADEVGFEWHLRNDGIPHLLDARAPWCACCRTMAPAFERAAAPLEPQVRLLKLNADEAPRVSANLGVRGIPALFLFQGGRTVAQTASARDADAIIARARDNLAAAPASRRQS